MLSLGNFWSTNTIDLYLHRKQIFLTGCHLHPAAGGGSRCPRLLPTEYLVILLDEDDDGDAMLLGAQFCSDSFSSISPDAFSKNDTRAFLSLVLRVNSASSIPPPSVVNLPEFYLRSEALCLNFIIVFFALTQFISKCPDLLSFLSSSHNSPFHSLSHLFLFPQFCHHTCARPGFIYLTLHLRIAAEPLLHLCLWMLPDQWRCVARWSPPPPRPYVFGTFTLLL
ncbi:hypothetical protein RchiOBHm_Chr4g0425061 [Rosa chinensis]|uniref:Cell division control protein 24 OB domain-containing protein n=1 Tax=Rosa chinensis TaxID=74649 RepID=A0A2P6QZ85_ROSCH|nr:hypothetical protein RchiOBHm_Chr4g0425061 [Rosa chinensis]